MKYETQVHRNALIKWGAKDLESVVLSGDLTTACEADGFRDAYPDRFINMGLMEQNMLSFAAGMAREGITPLIHTFAVFMYRRALDQAEMSIAYGDLPVRMFGFLPGVTTPGGPSHQATNDIAVMRTLPNMTIVEVGDATDIEGLYNLAAMVHGPLYVRMIRGEVPRLFSATEHLLLNQARLLSRGTDITLLTTGICTEEAMRVTGFLHDVGIGVEHLHITTLKPFTDPQVTEAIASAKYGIITMENHCSIGGLGSCVADLIAEYGLGKQLKRLSTGDRYLQGASQRYLMEHYGLNATQLVEAVKTLTGQDFGFNENMIADAVNSNFVGEDQVEAL